MSTTAQAETRHVNLAVGDPAPWFHQRSTCNPNYAFDTAAGRYVVLCFFASTESSGGKAALSALARHRQLFDDQNICFFGVSIDEADESEGRARESLPGIRFFWDFDRKISRLYGSILPHETTRTEVKARQFWLVLDPTLRVQATFPLDEEGHRSLFDFLQALPPPSRFAGFEIAAPVLVLPNVFENALCRRLVQLYESAGGKESGFMRDVGGKTVEVQDPRHKRRRDYAIEDSALISQIQSRILRRINPEITKAYCYRPTRMERYIVSCYAAKDGGHFRAHRDNTTRGTAHRRFAVSINLNDDFEGGELCFPEYGPRTYKAPPGGAVVFSGALLHAVTPVTQGRRYAFLPFVYDDEAARLREENAKYLQNSASQYRAGL